MTTFTSKIWLGLSLMFTAVLSGCSSSTLSESKYYLLNNQQAISSVQDKSESGIVGNSAVNGLDESEHVLLQVHEFPRYLSQANLVMQLDQHQLHYAHHHMWAEPLHRGFSKALLTDLNNGAEEKIFIEQTPKDIAQKLTSVVIDISYFHTTHQSKVILTGHYWLNSIDKNTDLPNKNKFYFEADLQQDGYGHSVAKMRELVQRLAAQISIKI